MWAGRLCVDSPRRRPPEASLSIADVDRAISPASRGSPGRALYPNDRRSWVPVRGARPSRRSVPPPTAPRGAPAGRLGGRDGRRGGRRLRASRSTWCAGPPCSAGTWVVRPSSPCPAVRPPSRMWGSRSLRPVQPMLAAYGADVAGGTAETGPASVEWKLDGARVQVHRGGDDVRIFTRNLNDITARLPGSWRRSARSPAAASCSTARSIGLDDGGRPRALPGHDEPVRPTRADGVPAAACSTPSSSTCCSRRRRPCSTGRWPTGSPSSTRSPGARTPAYSPLATADRPPPRRSPVDAVAAGHEGVMVKALDVDLRGGPAGRVLAEGEAGPHPRSRRPGRRMGPRPAHRLALQPPPRRPRARRRVRDGRQDLQRPHRRAAALADRAPPGPGHRDARATCARAPRARGGDRARRRAGVTRYPGGVALRFARVRRYREDKRAADADRIEDVQALLG